MQRELPVRKEIRLAGYDYSNAGYYYITICVKGGHEILWQPDVGAAIGRPCKSPIVGAAIGRPCKSVGGRVGTEAADVLEQVADALEQVADAQCAPLLSDIGNVVKTAIENISEIYSYVFIDIFTIMPNHIHMIIQIKKGGRVGTGNGRAMRAPTVSRIINQFKGYVTKQIGFSIWQKLFYDEIIRNEQAYYNIRKYIYENPVKWIEDEFYNPQL